MSLRGFEENAERLQITYRAISLEDLKPTTDESVVFNLRVDTTETVMIGGIKQVINIKRRKQVRALIAVFAWRSRKFSYDGADKFTGKLQKSFVVVQWDQRETGKTLQLNSSPVPLSVSLMVDDTQELIAYLLKSFGQKKLYLVGHSWGTVLGFAMADKHPELLYAYIAISPLVDQSTSEQMTIDMLKKKAAQDHNQKELDELNAVHIPFGNWKQLYFARKWLFAYSGQPLADADTAAVQHYLSSWSDTWLHVWNEAVAQNHFKDMPVITCPIYLFAGRQDHQTDFTITDAYYKQLKAPQKQLFWFEHSGHLIPNTEPDLLCRAHNGTIKTRLIIGEYIGRNLF